MQIHASFHVRPSDNIAAQDRDGTFWVKIETAALFANPSDLRRIIAACEESIAAQEAAGQRVAA